MKALFASAALALLAMLAGLHATAGGRTAQDGVPCLVWATDDNPVRKEQMAMFRAWHREKYGADVDIRIDPANYDRAKIVVQSVAGVGPDLFDYFGPSSLQAYVTSGIMLDVTDAAKSGGFAPDRFWSALDSTLAFAGRQYAVPDNTCGSLILVHADLLEAAGEPLPQAGWTWDDLRRLAKKLTVVGADGRVGRFGLLGLNWMELPLQGGGRWFDAGGARCAIDSPQATRAFAFYQDLIDRDHVMPTGAEMASMASQGGYGAGAINLFAAKRGAMMEFLRYGYINFNRINDERARAGDPPLRIVPLPPVSDARPAVLASGRCTAVNRRSAHRVEAVRFLEFLASQRFNDQINRTADSLSSVVEWSTGAAGISGGRAPIAGCDDPLWTTAMERADPYPSSRFISGAVLESILGEEFDKLLNHLQTPAETTARMRERIEAGMARYVADHPDLKREWGELRR